MLWIYILLLLLIPGCGYFPEAKVRSVGNNAEDDKVVITSAKERAISYMSVDYYKDGEKASQGRVKPKRVVCAEPSPDVATAVADAIKTSVEARASKPGFGEIGLDAEYSRNFSESLAQLGTRLATIQLLRDELSDLCRAYANGAVSSITYTLRLSRLDKKMITLLIGEAGAGALSRALVSASGLASAGRTIAGKDKLEKADQRIKDAVEALSSANKELKAKVEERNKETDQEKVKTADASIALAEESVRGRLAELSDRMLEKWALETQGSGLVAATTAGAIATLPTGSQPLPPVDLGSIHRTFLDNDDLGTLIDACLTSLEENEERTTSDAIRKLTEQTTSKQKDINKLESELLLAEGRAANVPAWDPNSQVAKEWESAKVRVKDAKAELDSLKRELEAEKGGKASGLASFCRIRGMDKIVDTMLQKINNRFSSDRMESFTSLCKLAIKEKATPMITECAKYGTRPFFGEAPSYIR